MNNIGRVLLRRSRAGRALLAILFICTGFMLWSLGVQQSRLLKEDRAHERKYLAGILLTRAPDYEMEKKLAEAYWSRYPDVRKDRLWGQGGTMGIRGPRDHFRLHGKREGRIWGTE